MFIEDIFTKFIKETVSKSHKLIPIADFDVCYSFYMSIKDGKLLTESQRTYILSLLARYRGLSTKVGFDYSADILMPTWRTPLRVINKDKHICVEEQENVLWICMTFPYQLKEAFDENIETIYTGGRTIWDSVNKIRKLNAYNINLLVLNEFIEKHGFTVDPSFGDLFARYESILAEAENIVPYATKLNNEIVLVNCPESAHTWWDENSTDAYETNLLLLKSMGIPYVIPTPELMLEKIACETTNCFWLNNISEFIKTCYKTKGRIGIVLDRASDTNEWLTEFFDEFNKLGYDNNDVKVCIKPGRNENKKLNEWLTTRDIAGSNSSKFLIFLHVPAKWIFKEGIEFSILGTNILYPSTNSITHSWMMSHSFVLYLSNICAVRPSKHKGRQIVKL